MMIDKRFTKCQRKKGSNEDTEIMSLSLGALEIWDWLHPKICKLIFMLIPVF